MCGMQLHRLDGLQNTGVFLFLFLLLAACNIVRTVHTLLLVNDCVCVLCVCVCARARVCVCVCVCVQMKEAPKSVLYRHSAAKSVFIFQYVAQSRTVTGWKHSLIIAL